MKESDKKLRYTYKEWEVFEFLQSMVVFATCSLSAGAYLVGLQKGAELRTPVLSVSGLFETIVKSQDELLSWGDVNWRALTWCFIVCCCKVTAGSFL